jgi:transposase-like protein
MVKSYSEAFKKKVITKALLPGGTSVLQLSKKLDVPKSTVYTWIKNSNSYDNTMKNLKKDKPLNIKTNKWTDEKKFQAVANTINLTGQEISEYCRKTGIYRKDLINWKSKMIIGLSAHKKEIDRKELQKSKAKTKELEKDLMRKDKALAEVSALLLLKKKVMELLEKE